MKKLIQHIDSTEDISVIEKLWHKLDQSIQNREFQLEQAIAEYLTFFYLQIFNLFFIYLKL
jgi:hypothetical protein